MEKFTTGNKDVDFEIMTKELDDKSLFNLMNSSKHMRDSMIPKFEDRIKKKYPTLVKWKEENEPWYMYYMSIVRDLAILKEKYNLDLDPFLFKSYSDQPRKILRAFKKLEEEKDYKRSGVGEVDILNFRTDLLIKHKLYDLLRDNDISKDNIHKFIEVVREALIDFDSRSSIRMFFTTLLELGEPYLFQSIWDGNGDPYINPMELEDREEIMDLMTSVRNNVSDYKEKKDNYSSDNRFEDDYYYYIKSSVASGDISTVLFTSNLLDSEGDMRNSQIMYKMRKRALREKLRNVLSFIEDGPHGAW